MRIWTIGHSTRPIEALLACLREHGVRQLVDVRTAPGSRRYPQFGAAALAGSLAAEDMAYAWIEALGGLRRSSPDSPNMIWRNLSFRGYADYMASAEFVLGLAELLARAAAATTVIMCAEAVPWRCHRSMISDALVARGVEVRHIFSVREARPHTLNPMAVVDAEKVVQYPMPAPGQLELVAR